ncbi:hypothetical protein HPG69_019373 [Diceros bicornis minor]|uniref:Sema domain-containing protein n=1 Tax=Diceros bicornis minor TaxID=77932 RepID=A0A7J7EAA4_DICBM|nr:hypothetical protein HPG69_019373 [Diceros bicornis minor]
MEQPQAVLGKGTGSSAHLWCLELHWVTSAVVAGGVSDYQPCWNLVVGSDVRRAVLASKAYGPQRAAPPDQGQGADAEGATTPESWRSEEPAVLSAAVPRGPVSEMKAMPWKWTCLLSHLLMVGMGSSTLLPRQPPPLSQKRSFVTFRGEPAEGFNHLVVDERTGHIYLGAVNRIYKLSSDLKVLVTHQTGPDEDNPKCYPPRIVQTCNEPLATTNNVNKMLLIDYKENRLIACGSLYQGICKLLRLEDLFKLGEPFHKKEHYLSGVNESGSVFGVIVSYSNLDDKLFIATAVDGKPEYFPTISSRKLTKNSEADGMFAYVFHDEFVASMIKIPSDTFTVIPDFDIYYVYGFSSGNFVYFLTLQPEMVSPPGSTTKEQVYTSKLVRLCKEDTAFNSYVEVPIGCERGGVEYRLLQAAYLSKAGAMLARTLGVHSEDDLLFTVFSKGQKRKMKSLDESALCIFILKQINDRIKERLQSCYRGEGTLDLAWLKVKDIPCSSAVSQRRGCGA